LYFIRAGAFRMAIARTFFTDHSLIRLPVLMDLNFINAQIVCQQVNLGLNTSYRSRLCSSEISSLTYTRVDKIGMQINTPPDKMISY
jgi:hypothetical protein